MIDVNSAAILTFNSSNRWLGVRVELLAAFVSSLIGFGFWLLRGQVAASFVGMCFIWNTTLLPHAGEDLPRFYRGVVMFLLKISTFLLSDVRNLATSLGFNCIFSSQARCCRLDQLRGLGRGMLYLR